MTTDSFAFLTLLGLAFIGFHISNNSYWRKGILLGTSATFVGSFLPSLIHGLPLLLFACSIIAAIFLLNLWNNKAVLFICLGLLISSYLLVKGYVNIQLIEVHSLVTVGMSYILFRGIQVLADFYWGKLTSEDLNLCDLLLYLFSFLTFAAGPIQSYRDFRTQLETLEKPTLRNTDFQVVLSRATMGYCKIIVLAPFFLGIHTLNLEAVLSTWWGLSLTAIYFFMYLYLNFSGAMDIAVSLGSLFGFHLPENFNRPYLAVNFIDFWTRWHITVSETFKKYIFFPLVAVLMKTRVGRQNPLILGIFGYFVIFTLLGVWHGNTDTFLFHGILLGVGAATNRLWQMKSTFPGIKASLARISVTGVVRQAFSSAITLGYYILSLVPVWPSSMTLNDVFITFDGLKQVSLSFFLIVTTLFFIQLILRSWKQFNFGIANYLIYTNNKPFAHATLTAGVIVGVLIIKVLMVNTFSSMNFYQQF